MNRVVEDWNDPIQQIFIYNEHNGEPRLLAQKALEKK